jgi:hypothetical protein
MPSTLLPPLLAAIEPIAAYVNRTPAGNKHADHCADLINAAADYADAVEAEEQARAEATDWQQVADCLLARMVPPTAPSPLLARISAHLRHLRLQARALKPLAERMLQATITSHHLGLPDYLNGTD